MIQGRPELANFTDPANSFDRTESRAAADWDSLAAFRDQWPGKLVIKGVLSVDDAVRLKAAGMDAIQVSSHGGRQRDCATPPILTLKEIREAVGDCSPVSCDSGLRSGEDVVKAYAMGAGFVFFGRVMQFATAAGGEAGLEQLWNILMEETSITLAQLGRTSMHALAETLVPNSPPLA